MKLTALEGTTGLFTPGQRRTARRGTLGTNLTPRSHTNQAHQPGFAPRDMSCVVLGYLEICGFWG
jgi:hypothetical protein